MQMTVPYGPYKRHEIFIVHTLSGFSIWQTIAMFETVTFFFGLPLFYRSPLVIYSLFAKYFSVPLSAVNRRQRANDPFTTPITKTILNDIPFAQ